MKRRRLLKIAEACDAVSESNLEAAFRAYAHGQSPHNLVSNSKAWAQAARDIRAAL